ncbi:MAG: RNA 3'-terminal phosphate cyclase [Planctomycetota bacterium]
MIVIDGAQGEGGGQVLRTSLALSLRTGQPFRLERIRARRSKPGLRQQHLSCVEAARHVGDAEVEGARLGAQTLEFRPRGLRAVDLDLDLGTAGSTTLVLQTVLPALLAADAPSTVRLRGGTHNPLAPPWEFLERTYFPLVGALSGATAGDGPVAGELVRPGFYPKGGGELRVAIAPTALRRGFALSERGALRGVEAEAWVAQLPEQVGTRELERVRAALDLPEDAVRLLRPRRPRGPGNALLLTLWWERAVEVVSACGERGKPAERVADEAVAEAQGLLASAAPVGEHTADQLLLLLALAGQGSFVTLPLSLHATTQIALIPRFLAGFRCETRTLADGRVEVQVGERGRP